MKISILGPLTSFLISFRRFLGLKYPKKISNTSKIINLITTIAFVMITLYLLIFMLISTFWNLEQINWIQQCLGQPEAKNNVSTLLRQIARVFEMIRLKNLIIFQGLMVGGILVPNLILQFFDH